MGIGKVAVFLDRDGVLNNTIRRWDNGKGREVDGPPWSVAELVLADEAPACVAELKAAGLLVIVVTNQPDVARGDLAEITLREINQAMWDRLPGTTAMEVCTHDGSWCACRKPEPGMLYKAAIERDIALRESFLVGDRAKDIDAAHAAGCRAIWIQHQGVAVETPPRRPAEWVVRSLREATDTILGVLSNRRISKR